MVTACWINLRLRDAARREAAKANIFIAGSFRFHVAVQRRLWSHVGGEPLHVVHLLATGLEDMTKIMNLHIRSS